jgi:hypothetical protein
MNVNGNRIARPSRMEEAPDTRPAANGAAMRPTSPTRVLAILKPTREEPPAILIGGLWKTGLLPEPQGAAS